MVQLFEQSGQPYLRNMLVDNGLTRFQRVLMIVYNTQNYWDFGLSFEYGLFPFQNYWDFDLSFEYGLFPFNMCWARQFGLLLLIG
jgi:hypothetical protein